MPADESRSRIEIEWDLQQGHVLHRHPWTRMAWRRAGKGARLYAGGETHALPVRDARTISAAPSFDGRAYAALSDRGRDAVYELLLGGHYHLVEPDGEASLTSRRRPGRSSPEDRRGGKEGVASCRSRWSPYH